MARFQQNSPVSRMLATESFSPILAKPMSGGVYENALKKLYGARLRVPSAARLEIQPIGRGAMIALKGECGRPWPAEGS